MAYDTTSAPRLRRPDVRPGRFAGEETLAGDRTLTLQEERLRFDPDGANRTLTLPATVVEGHSFFVSHSGSANTIDVGGLATLAAGDAALVEGTATAWALVHHFVQPTA